MKSSTTKIVQAIFLSLFIIGSLQVNLKPVLAENGYQMFVRLSGEQDRRDQEEKRKQETIGWIISLIFLGGSGCLCYWAYWAYKNSKKPK